MGGDHAGKGSGQHQNQQPRDALLGVGPHAGAKVGGGIVIRENGGHLLHILGALVGQNVDCIVDGDDTHEHALVVQNRHGGKVVALHLTGHILLVIRDLHGDHIVVHDVGNGRVQVGEQQAAGRHDAQQAVALHHIAGVHRLGVLALFADGVKGLAHGHVLAQADILGGHQAAGGAFRVIQQLVQALTGLLGGLFQHPLDHTGRHIFQQVGSIVQAHLFNGAHQLHIRESVDQIVTGFVGHIGKGLGGHFLFQQAEHHQTVVLVQLFQQFGQVGGLLFFGDLAQLDVLLFDQQLQQAALGEHFGVGLDLFVVGLLFFGLAHILLEVLGGFLVQVLCQLLAHLSGDIGGQFLHRQGLFCRRVDLLIFHFHGRTSSVLCPEDAADRETKMRRLMLPGNRHFRAHKTAPSFCCSAEKSASKRRFAAHLSEKGERSCFCCPIHRAGRSVWTMIRVHCSAFTSRFSKIY